MPIISPAADARRNAQIETNIPESVPETLKIDVTKFKEAKFVYSDPASNTVINVKTFEGGKRYEITNNKQTRCVQEGTSNIFYCPGGNVPEYKAIEGEK